VILGDINDAGGGLSEHAGAEIQVVTGPLVLESEKGAAA
jgi:hypothetical protein